MPDGSSSPPSTFGGMLRYLRKQAGLTQRKLGQLTGYSESQINKLESGTRLPDVKAIAGKAFSSALNLPPDSALGQRLIELAFAAHENQNNQANPAPILGAHNLPSQLSSFIGRRNELAELKELLRHERLVTLTGPGGSGKTRLAQELAYQIRAHFVHGVWQVELANLHDEATVPQAVADVLKVAEIQSLGIFRSLAIALKEQHILLVLDNCEHVLTAVARLVDVLLHACPHLKVLATSRAPLHVTGEHSRLVPALSLPRAEDLSLPSQRLAEFEAVRLFVERMSVVRNGSSPAGNAKSIRAIVDICRSLDGMPLAIEIAAARASTIGVIETHDRLKDRFQLLVGNSRIAPRRQMSLRTAIDWSIELLSPKERALLKRLAVFVGGWTLDAAEAVCTDDLMVVLAEGHLARAEIVDVLSALVDKSLVQLIDDESGVRYNLLESIRAYARTVLRHMPDSSDASGAQSLEASATKDLERRHAKWCLALAQAAERKLFGHEQSIWLRRLHRELDNIRAALAYFLAEEDAASMRMLAGCMRRFWQTRGRTSEGRNWLTKALGISRPAPPEADARAYFTQAVLDIYVGDTVAARDKIKIASKAVLETQDPWMTGQIFGGIVFRPVNDEQYVETRRRLETVKANAIQHGDTWLIGNVYHKLGSMELDHGHMDVAQVLFAESSAYLEQAGDRIYSMLTFMWLGNIALRLGQYADAEKHYIAGLTLVEQISIEYCEHIGIWTCLRGMAELAGHMRQPQRMATLLGSTEYESEKQGGMPRTWFPLLSVMEATRHYAEITGESVEVETYRAAWQRGRGLTLESVVEFALGSLAA